MIDMEPMQSTDGKLLEGFIQERDEKAFEELVRRHSSLVMGACRRILDNSHDAEDAFQATFLVLLQKGQGLMKAESLRGWLYQVAIRRAMSLRRSRLIREKHLVPEQETEAGARDPETIWQEVREVLDEELGRLTEKYRLPVMLCYLEGQTPQEAAAALHLNENTFHTRLARAKEALRSRLTRRGITLGSSVLVSLLLEHKAEAASDSTIESTVQAAAEALSTGVGVASAGAWELLRGVTMTVSTKKLGFGLAVAAALLLGILALPGMGWLWRPARPAATAEAENAGATQAAPARRKGIAKAPNAVRAPGESLNRTVNIRLPTSVPDYVERFKAAVATSDSEKRWQALRELGINLSDEDFQKAEAFAGRVARVAGKPDQRATVDYFHAAILTRWTEVEPAAAANWAERLLHFPVSETLGQFGAWRNPDASTFHTEGEESLGLGTSDADYARTTYIGGLGKRQMISWRNRMVMVSGADQGGLLAGVIVAWAKVDPEGARDWVQSLPDGTGEKVGRDALEYVTAMKDPERYLSDSMVDGASVRRGATRFAIAKWAKGDPQAVAAWVEQFPTDHLFRQYGSALVAGEWYRRDPQAARDWAIKQASGPDGDDRPLDQVVSLWASEDLAAARKWCEGIAPTDRAHRVAIGAIASTWRYSNPEAAAQWFQKLVGEQVGDDIYFQAVLHSIVASWARENPKASIDWVESSPYQISKDKLFDAIVQAQIAQVVSGSASMAYSDGKKLSFEEKVAVVQNLDLPFSYQEKALEHLLSSWDLEQEDLPQAANWLLNRSAGASRDRWITRFTITYSQQLEPPLALSLSEIVSDLDQKAKITTTVLQDWLTRDRAAATKWIAQSSLPQETKKELLGPK